MNTVKSALLLSLLSLTLVGCGKPTVDGSSEENFKSSLDLVRKSIPEERKSEFDSAIKALAFSNIGNIFAAASNPDSMKDKIRNELNGKNADEIIAAGTKVIEERKVKIKEQAIQELSEIKVKIDNFKKIMADSDRAKTELQMFKVLRSRFSIEKTRFSDEALIELTVKNDTKYPISRAYFVGTLTSPGRSIPWVQDSFNYKIPGGLEVGEEVTWKLTPNMFGEWGKAPKDRNDIILTVNVIRLDGADEKAIFDLELNEKYEEKIKNLESRLENLMKSIY